MYFTPLEPMNLEYIETDSWDYIEKNIVGIRLGKAALEFVIDEDENICFRQFTCGRFDMFNKFNRVAYAKLLNGHKNVLIYKSESFDDWMTKVAGKKGGHYEPIPLGFQVDK